ncbi:MAG: lactate racemase domain-containing protein [Chloroflexota bacterium]
MKVKVPQLPWHGDTELELDFPDSWEVAVCEMAGKDVPALTGKQIGEAFARPIGTSRIVELARGKKEAVILFDDMSRPTMSAELVPFILRELKDGGIKDGNIRFIAALGCHGAMKVGDFIKKLGVDIVGKYPVYNHNPYENCTLVGKTSRGTTVEINSEVMSCDLKIAIGAILTHPTAGFGGGAKVLLPGVASINTIYADHHDIGGRSRPSRDGLMGALNPSVGWGKVDNNALRMDIEEAAQMAGLDVCVNVVVNMRRETVGLFVGDLVTAHREGVKLARKVYTTPPPPEADIVVSNAYAKATEASLAVQTGYKLLKKEGGTLVIIANTPDGQSVHYLSRSFGKSIGGRLWGPMDFLPPRTKRMIALGPYIDRTGLDWMGDAERVTIAGSWAEIIGILKAEAEGRPRVVVVPDATLQYFPDTSEGKSPLDRNPQLAGEAL